MKELSVLAFVLFLLISGVYQLVSDGFSDSSARESEISEAVEGAKSLCDRPETFNVINISSTERVIKFSSLNSLGVKEENEISY